MSVSPKWIYVVGFRHVGGHQNDVGEEVVFLIHTGVTKMMGVTAAEISLMFTEIKTYLTGNKTYRNNRKAW